MCERMQTHARAALHKNKGPHEVTALQLIKGHFHEIILQECTVNVCSHTFALPFFKEPLALFNKGTVASDHRLYKLIVN
jgi:hypothetical protein